MRLIAYTRVSTQEQGQSGLGLESQRDTIQAFSERNGHEITAWIEDVQSGTVDALERLAGAIAGIHAGEAEGLVVSTSDRLSRTMEGALAIRALAAPRNPTRKNPGFPLFIVDMSGIDASTPFGRFVHTISNAKSELERDMISERTKAALAVARARGVVLGRPVSVDDAVAARIRLLRHGGLSFAAVADRLNEEGVPTSRGGRVWWPTTVRKVALRA